jgi:FkbM family methyltransferase
MKRIYFLVAKIFFLLGYFQGSARVQSKVFNSLPLKTGSTKHPLGFSWNISSRDALNTYLSSCEALTTRMVLSQADKLDTFICLGANRGWYPLVVGVKSTKIRIVAFECNSSIFAELDQNISENNNQAELHPFAIGDAIKTADLYMPKISNEGMSTLFPIESEYRDASFIERVNVTTLDHMLSDSFSIMGRTLILMDIEGSEMMALKGATQLLENCSPALILEINPEMLISSGSSTIELLKYLQDFNYEAFWIDERGKLVQVGSNLHLPHLSILPPHAGANYLFVKADSNWLSDFEKTKFFS